MIYFNDFCTKKSKFIITRYKYRENYKYIRITQYIYFINIYKLIMLSSRQFKINFD